MITHRINFTNKNPFRIKMNASINSMLREQERALNDNMRTELLFHAYMLTNSMESPTIDDLIASIGLGKDYVLKHLRNISHESGFDLTYSNEDHKNDTSKIKISLTPEYERSILRDVSISLKTNRFKV